MLYSVTAPAGSHRLPQAPSGLVSDLVAAYLRCEVSRLDAAWLESLVARGGGGAGVQHEVRPGPAHLCARLPRPCRLCMAA